VAIATGVAAFGAILLSRAADHISSALPALGEARADALAEAISSGPLPPGAPAEVLAAAQDGFVSGVNEVLLMGAGLSLAGAVLTLILARAADIRVPDESSS